ncbi:hypothetical protein J7W19_07280 [Streptomyces mobaraensis NBRC 13819 = DSM 40847]|uniref:Secreted protein n=1 Tax=Streptomyces mobaraensis (strain ATCC 29032 / DSM 40847 / JCM 4168 / NBRC 13819 / NCIMB 11159 / IPCR 16-22) TaxID=1223523 RepID=M3BLI8_STRM1|nr:hypothetical protein [Streptomyces mobaraensis]EMF00440.1 hypothetical protein H340_11500 [Streptomyces mobaraensis NBRC 13819 = DSM 40847]QTT73242.1 hypothetical protein J7W19_07280 [Streptomyces mobaraensis NBRC 13819 = DSM 40847]
MRRITATVFAALLTASLAGLTGTVAAVAAPTSVTANQCMLGGGEVRVISPSLKVCVGGIFDGQRVVG